MIKIPKITIIPILILFVLVGCAMIINTTCMESFTSPYKLNTIDMSNCKPECCPSTYSSDNGCVCLSPEDKKQIALRGGNTEFAGDFVVP